MEDWTVVLLSGVAQAFYLYLYTSAESLIFAIHWHSDIIERERAEQDFGKVFF